MPVVMGDAMRGIVGAVVACMGLLPALLIDGSARAMTLSCSDIKSGAMNDTLHGVSMTFDANLAAGDVILFTVTETAARAEIWLEDETLGIKIIPRKPVGAGLAATYTVPASGPRRFVYGEANSGTADFAATCTSGT